MNCDVMLNIATASSHTHSDNQLGHIASKIHRVMENGRGLLRFLGAHLVSHTYKYTLCHRYCCLLGDFTFAAWFLSFIFYYDSCCIEVKKYERSDGPNRLRPAHAIC